jgi:uncharacterized membrane protein
MNDLEITLGRLLGVGVTISSLALGAGLAVAMTLGTGAASSFLLTAGVLLLLATPIARVVVSSVGYARRRDWLFVLLTAIVLAELIASIVAAIRGSLP